MKNSIGSLAALAACMLPTLADAAPQASAFSNVIVPYDFSGNVAFDIDGDSIDDIRIFSNSVFVSIGGLSGSLVTPFTVPFGVTLITDDSTHGSLTLDDTGNPGFTTGYIGFNFTNGTGAHNGWIFLDFTDTTKYAVSAAWENHPGAGITVGAIPEPSAFAAVAGASALLGVSLRRLSPPRRVSLARAIAAARAQDLRATTDQEAPTRRRLLPAIGQILARLQTHRDAVDAEFHARRDSLGSGTAASAATQGEATLARYPIGFCQIIRDRVFDRLREDKEFHALIGPEVVLKKVFVLLKGLYFQNALQLGNLYVDVANDTVFVEKPPLEWAHISDVGFKNAEDWTAVAAVGRRYYGIELYPNLLFPLAFPSAPYFAIRASGRIDLFQAQNIVFLKDLGDELRRVEALLDDPDYLTRPLPDAYRRLSSKKACGGNLHAAFPLEYAPTNPAGLRANILPEFRQIARSGDAAALATIDGYTRLMEDATQRLARMNLRPSAEEMAQLRAEGLIPAATAAANGA